MIDFLQHLFEDGEIVVPRDVVSQPEAVQSLLIFSERIWRTDWPGHAPPFDVEIAGKALEVLFVLSQATVYRELDEVAVAARLQAIALAPVESASAYYSVDLTLRFLPQIYERLTRSTDDDPVLELVSKVAREWPLSSIGIPGCSPEALPAALDDPGLFRVYVDRVIAASDQERMKSERVATAVNAVFGPFDELRSRCQLSDTATADRKPQ